MVSNMEGRIVSSLLANEDVLFYWCIVYYEVPEDIANVVLKSIAALYYNPWLLNCYIIIIWRYISRNQRNIFRSQKLFTKIYCQATCSIEFEPETEHVMN